MAKLFHLCDEDTINNQIDFVAPMYIPEVWTHVEEMMKAGLEKTEDMLSLSDTYHRLACGEMVLWTVQQDRVLKGLALTELGDFDDGRICFIYFITGEDMLTWAEELHDEIITWAQANGCRKIKALGRPGWKKLYEHFGWYIASYEFALNIKQTMH